MTFTLTFGWWVLPTIITICSLIWALFIVDDGDGWFSGITNILALIPALGVSLIAWVIYAVAK